MTILTTRINRKYGPTANTTISAVFTYYSHTPLLISSQHHSTL